MFLAHGHQRILHHALLVSKPSIDRDASVYGFVAGHYYTGRRAGLGTVG